MTEGLWAGARSLAWEEDACARALVRDLGALTQAQVALALGISDSQVCRIEQAALRKLRFRMGMPDFVGSPSFSAYEPPLLGAVFDSASEDR